MNFPKAIRLAPVLAFFSIFATGCPSGAQTFVTGTIVPYSNGSVSETSGGTIISTAQISVGGYFKIPIDSTANHTFQVTPVPGSVYTQFSVSVTVPTSGTTDISTQLIAAMPIPNPFVIPALEVQTSGIKVNGVQYLWPFSEAIGPLCNDGSGNLVWGGCGGAGSNFITSLTTTGSSGAATVVNGVLNIPQYAGGVSSVYGRTGAVVATTNDYSFSQISGSLNLATQVTGTLAAGNVATLNQNTTGNAATATLATSALAAPYSGLTGSAPTWNQNTTGTAANLSGTPALPNGITATTQTTGDNSAKLATDAFVLANGYSLPQATISVLGGIKPDGTTCNTTAGVLSCPGTGGISGLTAGYYPVATSATAVGNGHLDDGVTTTATITSTEPITAPGFTGNGSTQGLAAFGVGTGTITATLPTNYVGITGPASGTPSYFLQLPSASPAGQIIKFATPSTVNGINQSVGTYISTTRSLGWSYGDVATGSALTTSEVGYITVPYACTLVGWHIMADAGTVTIKTARVNGGTALPTIGSNSISTSGVPLSTGTKVDSTTLTDFTSTSIAANDTLGFFITAVSGAKQITFSLDCAQ